MFASAEKPTSKKKGGERVIFHTHLGFFTWPPPFALLPRCGDAGQPSNQCVSHSIQMLGSCSLLRSSL